MDKQDIVQIRMPCEAAGTTPVVPSRAIQLKIGKNKAVIIYPNCQIKCNTGR